MTHSLQICKQENRTTCGVMYEVVMSIPKSEGMDPPPKIPANPSFVELDEDENAVEKFKTAMVSISSILHLDKLKQVSCCYYLPVVSHRPPPSSVGCVPEGEVNYKWQITPEENSGGGVYGECR